MLTTSAMSASCSESTSTSGSTLADAFPFTAYSVIERPPGYGITTASRGRLEPVKPEFV